MRRLSCSARMVLVWVNYTALQYERIFRERERAQCQIPLNMTLCQRLQNVQVYAPTYNSSATFVLRGSYFLYWLHSTSIRFTSAENHNMQSASDGNLLQSDSYISTFQTRMQGENIGLKSFDYTPLRVKRQSMHEISISFSCCPARLEL